MKWIALLVASMLTLSDQGVVIRNRLDPDNPVPGGGGGGGGGSTDWTRIASDSFESGSVAGFWTGGAPCPVVTTAPDGGAAYAGTKQASCNWSGAGACTHDMELAYDPFGASNTGMFIRFQSRLDADMDLNDGSKLGRIGFQGDNEVIFACQMEQGTDAALYADMVGVGTFFGTEGSSAQCDNATWHKLEFYVKRGSGTSGVFKAWVDDTLVYSVTGDVATAFNLYLHSNWSCNPGWEHDANNHQLIDNVEIFTDTAGGTATTGTAANGDIEAVP